MGNYEVDFKTKKLQRLFIAGAVMIIFGLILSFFPSIMLGNIEARILALESQTSRSLSEKALLTNLQTSRGRWVIMRSSTF